MDPSTSPHLHPHDISGFWPLIRLGEFSFPTYYVVISVACCICIVWLVKRTEKRVLSRTDAIDLALALMIMGFIGARLFHVLFEEPGYYLDTPFRIVEFWNGGFVWYGGAILGAASAMLLAKKKKIPLPTWLDLFAPVIALGYMLGRVACLFTGCCYGEVCLVVPDHPFRHPTQAYAIATEALTLLVLLWLEKARREGKGPSWARPAGRIFFVWLALHSAGRILMEAFRADPRGPAPLGVSFSTWISLLLIAVSAIMIFRKGGRR